MAQRIHQLILTGDAGTLDRLGIECTEGASHAVWYRPDSEYGEQTTKLDRDTVRALHRILGEIVADMDGEA